MQITTSPKGQMSPPNTITELLQLYSALLQIEPLLSSTFQIAIMSPPKRQLEFINMTNQSEEEKRERISKTRAVMMKDSHRERRRAREAGVSFHGYALWC